MLRLFLLLSSTLLWGCAQFHYSSHEPMSNNDKAYLKATSLPSLIIPEDLKNISRLSPLYPVPGGPLPEPGKKAISPVPPGIGEVVIVEIDEVVQ